ncbi:hypothetical protein CVU37_06375 [candidate division BRC1 bacterium HGW-BRC1-1]|nr:MAG: hypothetical protein CVU37_06375 [candidate division BRC1 bacterium HGW-BRC1-1]
MNTTIGCGIIGYGGIAAVHLEAIQRVPGMSVVGVHDIDPEALQRGATAANCTAHPDLSGLLTRDDIQCVIVATPPSSHSSCTLQALQHGLHVLCEKPVAMNAKEAIFMLAQAAAAGVRLIPGFCHRHAASTVCMRRMISEGAIGEPLFVHNQFWGPAKSLLNRWYTRPEVSGGGVVMDTLVHSIDLFHALVGYAAQVTSSTTSAGFGINVEDSALITLHSESGVLGSLAASWAVANGRADLAVYGTGGSLSFDYSHPDRVIWQKEDNSSTEITVENAGERFANQLRHFSALVRGEAVESLVTERDAIESMRVVDQVYQQV